MSQASASSDRRLAVIMFTDVVGYTALMQQNESKALHILSINREIQKQCLEAYSGKFLKEIGDGILASFDNSTEAIQCAEAIHTAVRQQDFELRIGLHQGEVIFTEGDVYGDGVNIASRVQELAVPNSILFTRRINDDLENKSWFQSMDLGQVKLKNIDRPVPIFALKGSNLVIPESFSSQPKIRSSWQKITLWPLAFVLGAILIFLGVRHQLNNTKHQQLNFTSTTESPATLAVIPFSNLTEEGSSDFLGFALADEVISSLTYLKDIIVRPSSSVRKYINQISDPAKIATELNVNYILMGHYLSQDDSLKLNLELIDIVQNRVQWSGTVKDGTKKIFQLQEAVSNEIIKGLKLEFSQAERERMVSDVSKDPLAYEYYLRSLAYPSTLDGYRLGLEMARKSIELDSTFAPAYVLLGDHLSRGARFSVAENQNQEMELAIDFYNKALDLNPNSIPALANIAMIYTELDQKEKAFEAIRRAIDLNPNNAFTHFALGYICRYVGLLEEATNEMITAVSIDPTNRRFRSIITTLIMADQMEDIERYFNIDPASPFNEGWIGVAYLKMNKIAEARLRFEKAISMDPDGLIGIWCEGFLSTITQQDYTSLTQFMAMQDELEDGESIYWNAVIFSLIGQQDLAIQYMQRAIDKGFYPYPYFLQEPFLDPIRNHPEFDHILKVAEDKHLAFKSRFFPG